MNKSLLLEAAPVKFLGGFTEQNFDPFLEEMREVKICVFSASLSYVPKILEKCTKLEYAEIIVGNAPIRGRYDFTKIMALQSALVVDTKKLLRKNKAVMELVYQGKLKFYFPDDGIIHGKFYLFENVLDDNYLTITGSANLSKRAWENKFNDIWLYSQDHVTYNLMKEEWETLKTECSLFDPPKDVQEITSNPESNAEELPVLEKLKTGKSILMEKVDEGGDFVVVEAAKKEGKWQKIQKEVIVSSSENRLAILPESIEKIKYLDRKFTDEKDQSREAVVLKIEDLTSDKTEETTYSIKNKILDLDSDEEQAKSDLETFIQFTEGAKYFTGDTLELKKTYFKILTYFFVSPYLGLLCKHALEYDFSIEPFPMYMLVQGGSDAGKSSLFRLLYRMMLGKKLKYNPLDGKSFKPSIAYEYQAADSCLPVYFDDVTSSKFWRIREIAKSQNWLAEKESGLSPVLMFSSNGDVKLNPEESKRILSFYVQNRLSVELKHKNTNKMGQLINQADNAFYRYYLAVVEPKIKNIMRHIEDRDFSYIPDVFAESSKSLIQACNDLLGTVPEGLEEFSFFELMGEASIGKLAKDLLINRYKFNRKTLCTRYVDGIRYLFVDFSSLVNEKAREQEMETLLKTVPAYLEPARFDSTIRMKFEAAQDFLGIKLKVKNRWF